MNITVCLKQVPETVDVKIDAKTESVVKAGLKNIINPLDTYALEEGVRLKERFGGKVTVISMGPPPVADTLKEAISLGADEGVLLSDNAFEGADTWATAFTLSAAIGKIGQFDLVICGRQAVDGDTGQVGPQLAEMLRVPVVTNVSKIEEVAGGGISVRRMTDEGQAVVQASLPALITVTKEINVPRLPSLRSIVKSRSAVIPVWGLKELGLEAGRVGLAGSFTEVVKLFQPVRSRKSTRLQGDLKEQVELLFETLKTSGLV